MRNYLNELLDTVVPNIEKTGVAHIDDENSQIIEQAQAAKTNTEVIRSISRLVKTVVPRLVDQKMKKAPIAAA
ncbi:hypothetical protein [Aeromonas media]|uniref:hypothetical protein n=1 Tax=Aeromonas media TaxID=651 RepID=UPI003D22EE7B